MLCYNVQMSESFLHKVKLFCLYAQFEFGYMYLVWKSLRASPVGGARDLHYSLLAYCYCLLEMSLLQQCWITLKHYYWWISIFKGFFSFFCIAFPRFQHSIIIFKPCCFCKLQCMCMCYRWGQEYLISTVKHINTDSC